MNDFSQEKQNVCVCVLEYMRVTRNGAKKAEGEYVYSGIEKRVRESVCVCVCACVRVCVCEV